MNTRIKSMNPVAAALVVAIFFAVASAQAQTPASKLTDNSLITRSEFRLRQSFSLRPAGFALMRGEIASFNAGAMTPLGAGPGLQVLGSGTVGRLTKWTGLTSSNSFIGDSTIFESKSGLVGIGTDAPTSKLTIAGMIETTLGGLKFPDGTVQTTAFNQNQVVRSLNGLTGNVTLQAGANIQITPSGNALIIAAPNALTGVVHDTTLQGVGTSGAPLGVAIPLNLTGSVPGNQNKILKVVNTGDGGSAFEAVGGDSASDFPGNGIKGVGGKSGSNGITSGIGVIGIGGSNNNNINAGAGMSAVGGDNDNFAGGTGLFAGGGRGKVLSGFGVDAFGGLSTTGDGGAGVRSFGGEGGFAGGTGSGGRGVIAVGGNGRGAGKSAGDGIFAADGAGTDGATNGRAGAFQGLVAVNGDLNVSGTKNFKIDHPLDPENKYLYHAAIESSEVLNIYSGNVTINENGEATVTLPNWFEALNKDFRYQLTPIGAPAQGLYIAEKVSKNHFKIAGGQPGMEVSWQVTGVRSDAAMRQRPFKAEQDKPELERGTYLTPDAFGQAEEKGSEWARNPELMQRVKDSRVKQTEQLKQKAPIH